ncbi:MAG: insulinase family protein [Ignavibacteriota bacterium]|nr:insulinase family protein [Ignavibacteriales bacterium]MBL1121824.1 insulinase family protein [Ignavibacteriota bacterium]MBV6421170.1 putative zinc protease [Ignavibacteriaceae bacterium]MCE7855286.1 insulinase family protein [Ignavibacteria bacterium CHB3]MEB2295581.1 pitrilysin family protein [Ignavibacteria bacterium]
MENYYLTTLPNGTKIVSEFIPHVQSFTLGFWFNVGARDESIHNNGISHFIEHMLFKGTKKRSAKMIAEEIESYGGYLNAFTSKEQTCYYSKGLSENLGRTFCVLSDLIQNPLFKETHIKREAGVVIDELKDIDDNPEELLYDKFEEIIFNGNHLSYPVIGREVNIRNFHSNDLFNFHRNNYSTNGLLIVASGNLKHDHLIKLTEKYIVDDNSKRRIRREQFHTKKVEDTFIEKDVQQVHTIIGRATYGYNDKNRIPVRFLSALLGEGSSSRLFLAVREKLGITYQINSFLNSYNDTSAFGVYFSTNQNQYAKVIDIVYKEFKKLKEIPITEKELKKVKEYLKGGILLSLESTTNRMMRIANSILYYNKVFTVNDYLSKIEKITVEDVQKTARELLNDSKLIKVILKSETK